MKSRGLLIAVVVLAILSGLLYWSEHRKPAEESANSSSASSPAILNPDQAAITQITIKKNGAETVTLVKEKGGQWQITGPQALAADQEAVSGLLFTLAPLNSQRIVEKQGSDLKKYGLDPPAMEVDVTAKGRTQQLLIGDATPTGDAVYAMVGGNPTVFTMASFNETSLDKGVNDLRDRRLLTVSSEKVTSADLVRSDGEIEFRRDENGWQIVKPKPLRADTSQVDQLLDNLTGTKMDLNQPDAKEIDAAYARGTPVATVKLTDESGTQELQVRKNKDDYYAKSSIVPGIYKVGSSLGQALGQKLDDFRNKKLFDFSFEDPNKVDIHIGAKDYAFTRIGQDWLSNGKKMEAEGVEGLVSQLRDLTASKFADSGFSKPTVEVTVTSNDGKRVEKILLAKSGDGYLAQRENEPSLYRLDASTVDAITKAVEAVKPAAASH